MSDPLAQLKTHFDNPAMGHMQGFLTDLVGTLENALKEIEAGIEDKVNAAIAKVMQEFEPAGHPDPAGPDGPAGPTSDDDDGDEHVNENS